MYQLFYYKIWLQSYAGLNTAELYISHQCIQINKDNT